MGSFKNERTNKFISKIKSIVKSGKKPFIIIYQDNLLEQDAFELEKELITFYGRKDINTGCLCNLTGGGEGSGGHTWYPSEETKNAISVAKKGIPFTEGHKKNLSIAHIGVSNGSCSEETKNAIRNAQKGIPKGPLSDKHKKNISISLKGVPKSEEHKKNMRKPLSEEHKKAISDAHTGVPKGPHSEETKKAMSISHKEYWRIRKKKLKEEK